MNRRFYSDERTEVETARSETETARSEAETIRAREEALRADYTELLDFSNGRDAEAKTTIADLERRICELRDRLDHADPTPQNEAEILDRLRERENDILCLARQLASVSEAAKEREEVLLKRIEDLERGSGSLPL